MFSVPGWSLSVDKLKAEVPTTPNGAVQVPGVKGPSTKGTGANATQLLAQPPVKKRKRNAGDNGGDKGNNGVRVTANNVAELWERVIEKREPKREAGGGDGGQKKTKRQKNKHKNDGDSARKSTESAVVPNGVKQSAKGETTVNKGKKDKTARVAEEETQERKPSKNRSSGQDQPEEKSGKRDKKKKRPDTQPEADVAAKTLKPRPAAPAPATSASSSSLALALPPAPPKLTPLQASMRAKLVSARFRHLNETLYTSPSVEALRLFAESPDMFQAYHEGFRQQVAVWPENPVDGYIAEVRRRAGSGGKPGKGGQGGRGGGRGGRGGSRGGRGPGGFGHWHDPADTLPRTRGLCRLADIGCGDARLATVLAPDTGRLRIEVLSYDLHADPANAFITAAADASDLPLGPGSVDVAVFCLALMGTNWLAFVEEAYRVLRWKGELWVAEIKSRFAGAAEIRARLKQKQKSGTGGRNGPVSHSVGFRRKKGAKNGGAPEDDDDPDVVAAATAEVDGGDEGGSGGDGGGVTTDVSAFIRALRRRGFVLDEAPAPADKAGSGKRGDGKPPAVDLSNKMFVKMRFVKAAPATAGKAEVLEALNSGRSGSGGDAAGGKKKLKFLDEDGSGDANADPMDDPELEAKILKPCVYKLR